ncbi:Thiamine-binding periplasmic protein precursor [Fusobacterium necrogenes]|uniref:Thiamine-binding periplasmic protein n=1 Tax=Fusobacterium necrogenes TaxID=858 RepID=A0A377GXJ8_9FUSO|nr:thiamine ABC transporter substrate-binding protein [Fusobacterium necrogenes]STO31492.1 Thiamine-binding periplasmic protein precursor [Fusobacterium necrogenes]
MRKILFGCLFIIGININAEEIIIYGPSSMKWIEKEYGRVFKKETGDSIKFISIDGIVGRLKLEKKRPRADVVVGLTELTTEMARRENLILPYVPKNIDNIANESFKMSSEYVIPMDYGILAINYNKEKISTPPKSLKELGAMTKQLMVENPKVSITGEEALQWSIALYGENWLDFWKELKPAIYSVEPGWSEAFAKFTAGEAPMMVGYATSNLFFTGEDSSKYDSFLLEDGNYIYQEGAALVNKKEVKDGAKKFMERVLSDKFQKIMSEENYMFPVTNIEVSEGFKNVPTTDKTVKLTKEQIEDLIENLDIYKTQLIDILKK